MPIRSFQSIAPMLLTIAANQETDPDSSWLSLRDLTATLGFTPNAIAAFIEDLTIRGVLTWVGRSATCPTCGTSTYLGAELPTKLTCSDGTTLIGTWVIDDLYRWALPFPTNADVTWPSLPLTMEDLAALWCRSAASAPGAQTYTLAGATPNAIQIQVVDADTWYLTAILGHLAFYTYHARSQHAFQTMQAQLVADLGGQVNYDAVATLQQLSLEPTVGADLLLAGGRLLELPRLAAFAQTASLVMGWQGQATAPWHHEPVANNAQHALVADLAVIGPECYHLAPPLHPSAGERIWVWKMPVTPARRAIAATLPHGWCILDDAVLIANTASAWEIWRQSPDHR